MSREKKSENGGVKLRVRGWFHEMRKKSHVTVQKWVDSISLATDEDDTNVLGGEREKQNNCDKSELNQPSTSSSGGVASEESSVKGKISEICNKLNVNEKLKSNKVQELKNLLTKKINKHKAEVKMEQQPQNTEEEEDEDVDEEVKEVKRCHLSQLGRSVSESPRPPPRTRRLTDIGRSYSVAQDNELPTDSTENLVFDAEDASPITSPSAMSNSQLDRSLRPPERPLRMHTVSEGCYPHHVVPRNQLLRDCSFQSDESHCSSVESLLEQRKPDAEAILMNLGFGPNHGSDDLLSKIPKRFLKPSQVKGVDTDTFLKNQQLSMNIHENSVLGYRGLLGNSHVPSDIVKAIMHRFSQNELRRMESMENISTQTQRSSFKGVANTILAQRHFLK